MNAVTEARNENDSVWIEIWHIHTTRNADQVLITHITYIQSQNILLRQMQITNEKTNLHVVIHNHSASRVYITHIHT